MPLFDFRCKNCGETEERFLYNPPNELPCPSCGGITTRLFSGGQMIKMKGMGGYPSRRKQILNTTKREHPKLK